MSQVEPQHADEQSLVNSIGSILSLLKGGPTSTAVGPSATDTSVGPMTDHDLLTNIQSGQTQPKPPATTPLTGEPVSSGGISGDEANPVPNGPETVSQGYGGEGGHPGVDIGVPVGTTLVAAIGGTVTVASNADPGGYGNYVEITGPNGISVRYGHLSYIGAKVGQTVRPGQPIGKSGGIKGAEGSGNSDGPHLHFEVRQNGHSIDPMHFLAIKGNGLVAGTPGELAPTAAAPTKPVAPQDAVDTGMNRLTGILSGKGDPGSENAVSPEAKINGAEGTTGADNDPAALGAFLAATKQHESGGNYSIYNTSGQSNASGAYQFIGTTWKSWGGSTANAAEASPAEQDAVAARMATALFNQFHSWRLVAIAWYGGPGVAAQVAAGQDPGSPSGQGPYMAYGDTIAKMMAGGK